MIMEQEDIITKFTVEITRDNGSQARITATRMGAPLHTSVDVYVHRRDSTDHEWTLCSNRPHPDWRTMPVDDYIKFGRSEQLKTVSHGEILKTINMIGKPMSAADAFH